MRFTIRVRPNASRTSVGGRWAADALIVAVPAPAVDGKANEAVRRALAEAFGIRRQQVRIVRGDRGRDKVIELDPEPPDARSILTRLLDST
jgi:uncharacterized protein (TIGR00251 family)